MVSFTRAARCRYSLFFLVCCAGIGLLFLLPSRDGDGGGPTVLLESPPIQSDTDTDGDGVPDWQEDVTDSDFLNETSFPYRKDIVRAKSITTDDLLYGGPGAFTEDIVRRFLSDTDGSATVSDSERERFVGVSVDYFLERVERRGLPPVRLYADNDVSRAELRDDFLLALKRFSEGKVSFESLVFEIFAKNTAVLPEARKAQSACDYTLTTIPRGVPIEVYDPYYLVLERIVYLCESLNVALADAGAENYFYVLKLLSTGRLFDDLENVSEEILTERYIRAASGVVSMLE